jgi:hypothetical protein
MAWGGEKHGCAGADSRSGSVAAGHGSAPGQGIPCPVAGLKLAGSWAVVAGNWPKSDLGKRKLFFL